MALITCRDAAFSYEGVSAASGIDFTVNCGDYLCIVGENGSGKSTLIKGLLRLKQPQQGEIILGEGLKADDIGYLPQQSAVQQDFPASVYEVVISGRLGTRGLWPFYTRQDKAAALENMRRFNIEDLRGRCYRELSGGQRQRVLLARALCSARRLLLLDEPAAGLDPLVTQDLYHLVDGINKNDGIAIVMVSHDVKSAAKYASHILHLRTRQAFFGLTGDYVKSSVGRAFLGDETDA
ncbi:MAG: metal ABC transporter ATP-binding protein [Acidaminococcales bacterium]|jgi:zinc transport system ATP-binding protein|nr:metal ABC transporter ATP-binding protein [Acidaminococcales bacterium]